MPSVITVQPRAIQIDTLQALDHPSIITEMPGVVPSLRKIDASEQTKIIECLKENGCAIIKNFTVPVVVDQVNQETRPYLEKDKPWKVSWPG